MWVRTLLRTFLGRAFSSSSSCSMSSLSRSWSWSRSRSWSRSLSWWRRSRRAPVSVTSRGGVSDPSDPQAGSSGAAGVDSVSFLQNIYTSFHIRVCTSTYSFFFLLRSTCIALNLSTKQNKDMVNFKSEISLSLNPQLPAPTPDLPHCTHYIHVIKMCNSGCNRICATVTYKLI